MKPPHQRWNSRDGGAVRSPLPERDLKRPCDLDAMTVAEPATRGRRGVSELAPARWRPRLTAGEGATPYARVLASCAQKRTLMPAPKPAEAGVTPPSKNGR